MKISRARHAIAGTTSGEYSASLGLPSMVFVSCMQVESANEEMSS